MLESIVQKRFFTIQYEVNDACNLRCSHCYQGTKTIKESTIALEQLFHQIEGLHEHLGESYRIAIRLTGGEVFLRKDLMDLLVSTLKKHYITMLLTNGTLITPQNALKVMLGAVAMVQVSLDGPNAQIHDTIRGQGQFEKALAGIQNLKKVNSDVAISYTLMAAFNDHVTHFEELVQLADRLNLTHLRFSRMFPQGDGLSIPQFAYTNGQQYKRVLEDFVGIAERNPHITFAMKDPLIRNLDQELPSNLVTDVCCYIKKDYLSVAADGSVYACRKLGKPVGNLHEQTLADIWMNNPLLQQMADRKLYMQGKCASCPIQNECQGGCLAASYGVTRQLFVPDPACWREEAA